MSKESILTRLERKAYYKDEAGARIRFKRTNHEGCERWERRK